MFKSLFAKAGVSLERLQSFCRVAEMESFTQAAGGDANRQSLYSRQIKDLENYFGTELFRRKGRTVLLTQSGAELYSLLCEYFSAFEDFAERCGSDFGNYVVGAGDSLIQWLLLPRLRSVQAAMGRARLSFKNMRTSEIVAALERGDIDYGIIRGDAASSRLGSVEVGVLKFSLFIPKDKNTDVTDTVTLLSDLSFVGMEGKGIYQSQMEDLARQNGVMIRYAVDCSSFPMMARAMKELRLAGFLPSVAQTELDEGTFSQASLPGMEKVERSLVICWNARKARLDDSLATRGRAFAELIRI